MAVSLYSNFPVHPPISLFSSVYPPLLGPDNRWVVGGVRQRGVLAVVQEAVAPAAVADEEEGSQEDQGTDGAGLPLQQEAEQVEAHEHGVVEPQRRVQRLGDEQHWEQPL